MDILAYRLGRRRTAGCCMLWDAIPDGREEIDLTAALGLCFYRVSALMLTEEDMRDVHIVTAELNVDPEPTEGLTVVGGTGWVGVFADGELPILISGRKGAYEYEGVAVDIPADGTYFAYDPESGALFSGILQPAAI